MTTRGSHTIVCIILFMVYAITLVVSQTGCGLSCPFGNNNCTNPSCSRCFPNLTPNARCIAGAQCGELCVADTDCNQTDGNLCLLCRLGRCSANCGGSCLSNQDCNLNQQCSNCDPDTNKCITGDLLFPGPISLPFSTENGKSNANWYYPSYCSNDCSTKSSGSNTKTDPGNGLIFSMSKCAFGQDCLCRGNNEVKPTCYGRQFNVSTSGVISGRGFGPGEFSFDLTAPIGKTGDYDVNAQSVIALRSDRYITEHDQATPGASSIELVLYHIDSAPSDYWSASLLMKLTNPGKPTTCASAAVPINLDLAYSKNTFSIDWSPYLIRWKLNGEEIGTYPDSENCPIPQNLMYVTYSHWPLDQSVLVTTPSTSEIFSFSFSPINK